MYCYWNSSSEILILCQTSDRLHRLTEQVSTEGGREGGREKREGGREREREGEREGGKTLSPIPFQPTLLQQINDQIWWCGTMR